MKKIILSAAILFSSLVGISQIKEGSITYEVVGIDLPPEMAAAFDGTEQQVFFKNDKSRNEFTNAFTNMIIINDGKKTTVLNDQMGQKTYFEMTDEDVKSKEDKKIQSVIEYKDETKKIAGYDCKKAIIKTKDEKGEETKMIVWYTDQLPFSGQSTSRKSNAMSGLKGAPLEYESRFGPMMMKHTATAVSKAPVADSKFVANTEGYVKQSLEEMKKMSGAK